MRVFISKIAFLLLVVNIISIGSLHTTNNVSDDFLDEFTKKIRNSYEQIKFHEGGIKAQEFLQDTLSSYLKKTPSFKSPSDKQKWIDYLKCVVTSQNRKLGLDHKSERWKNFYWQVMSYVSKELGLLLETYHEPSYPAYNPAIDETHWMRHKD
jgi:hypothetical protein